MKTNLRRVLQGLFVSCCGCVLLSQTPGAIPKDVQILAERTVEALRANDAGFFSSVVDPAGIVIGVDEPPMSAVQFRKEIAKKRGVFCALFDATNCSYEDVVMSKTSSSLHHLVVGQKTIVQTNIQGISNGSQIVSATVTKPSNPNEVVFTLYFRSLKGRWVLANINYE